MDHISNEASVDRFPIGPSGILGRTIAFRVLFCKSMSHFRHQIFHVLLDLFYRFRGFLAPIISWLHPRNPQGILAMMTIVAFLLKRYTSVKVRAEMAYRRKFWRNMMRTALTYEEWAHAAKMLDKETPKMNESDLYDVELVRNKLQELHHRRHEGSLRDIIFCMRADLVRNLGNMCNPELHKGRLQVPKLIKEYIDEVLTQLRMVCDSDSEELSLEEKLAFMHETRHAFGRTALLLSGGASLGASHVGVVKTLVEHKLLPRIIAGSSVGSIMCAVVATRSWPELQSFFEDSWHSLQFFDQMGGIFTVVKRVTTYGAVHEIRHLQMMLRHLTSNLTFQEAYDMTGRILGITVCSPRKHEPPRCLNYLTSPHVVIWSAVTASCAFPGLYEAQELMAKDRSGEIVPYHPPFNLGPEEGSTPVRRWRDGSLEIDLPMMQLKELFNVNHFIVSQANPHIAPLLRLKEFVRTYGGNFAAKLAHLAEMEVKHRCNQILELGFPLGGLAKLFAQDWEGDVTVVMPATLAQYSKIIQNPSYGELQKAWGVYKQFPLYIIYPWSLVCTSATTLLVALMMNGRNRFPFTPSQWQELEHQALIYKYMASGISIPPDLLFTIKRSYFDSPLSSRLLPNQPQHFGWNYLQMGLGRKIDPEPGRCRRTDGKKWRCSKEAYPDSKYCERHMHRGKNRSRKPVEVLKTTTPSSTMTTTNTNSNASSTQQAISSITKINTLSPLASSETHQHHPQHYGSFLYHHHPPSRSSGIGLSFEDNRAPLFLDTGSCSQSNTDCRSRYVYGEKEEVDEHAFFTEPCGVMKSFSASSMDDSWQLTPLTMSSSSSSSKQRSSFGLSSDYSCLQLQSHSKQQQQEHHQDQGCYMFGGGQVVKEEPQKTVHRFFDEWPHKGREGSWLDLDDKSSTTQLSISIPTCSHDFPTFSSRNHHDG